MFNQYPYINENDLNLDYILKSMKTLKEIMDNFITLNTVTFADPIIWDITKQYARNTIVLDPSGNAYLSKVVVPTGVQLNNGDYWLEIFNFTDYTRTANQNLTVNAETNTTRATHAYNMDDWLIWNDVLYKVTAAIAIDDALVIGTNLVHFTVEDFIKAFMTWATNTIQQYKNDIDASELAYKNAIDASELAFTTNLQNQFNQAVAGVTVDSEVLLARVGWDGFTYTTLGTAIQTQISDIENLLTYYGNVPFRKGYRVAVSSSVVDLDPQANNNCEYITIDVTPGEIYRIKAYQAPVPYYAWAVFNVTEGVYTRLARCQATDNSLADDIITIPATANKLVVNNRLDEFTNPCCIKKLVPTLEDFNEIADYVQPINNWSDARASCTATNLTIIDNVLYQCQTIEVTAGEQFYINCSRAGTDTQTFYPYAMYYYDGNTYSRVQRADNDYYYNGIVTIPDNVNLLVINNRKAAVANPICLKFVKSSSANTGVHIRIGTYNCGDFTGDTYPAGSDEGALVMRQTIGNANADVWGLQFDVPEYTTGVSPRSAIFSQFQYYSQLGNTNYNYKALGGYYPIVNVEKIDYVGPFDYPARHSYFMVGDLIINGMTIKVATMHLDWSDKRTRRQQIDEIIAYMADYSYKIVLGDINPSNFLNGERVDDGLSDHDSDMLMLAEELPKWTAANYKIANGGDFGWFYTIRPNIAERANPCDNIFISRNLFFKNVKMIEADYMFDHRILIADIAVN